MNQRSPVSQRQQPWQERSPSNSQSHQSVVSPSSMVSLSKDTQPPNDMRSMDQQKPSQQQQNPFRGRKPEQDTSSSTKQPTQSDDKSQSISSTPRRKGNPQSPAAIVDSLELQRSRSNSSAQFHDPNVDLTTPLATLSTILTTTKSYHGCAIKNYRVNHKLFRDAKDRTTKAAQALAQAKAEYEHATTAQEYAYSELNASLATKQQCETHTVQVEKQVRKLGQQFNGKQVKLVGLTQNIKWNGRTGVIVKLVVEGEDCGRWKVRLDKERRGGDPEGMDGRDSLNGETRDGDVDRQQHNQNQDDVEEDEQIMAFHHVVAKAENLQLLEEIAPIGFGGGVLPTTSSGSTQSRSRSKSRTSSRSGRDSGSGKSRDPSTSRYSESFKAHSPRSNTKAGVTVAVTPDHQVPCRKNSIRSPLSPPEISEFASAFRNMLQSPVSFEQPSFRADSFNSSANISEEQMRIKSRSGPSGEGDRSHNRQSDSSIAGSFFDEVTPQDLTNQSYPHDEDKNQPQYHGYEPTHNQQYHEDLCHHSVEGESHRGYPQEIYSTDLPTLVILPVQEDEHGNSRSPHCIGVQGAGVPHINGIYVLANDPSSSRGSSSPLYFKDSPPTQLEDNRYYDMCILRIDCPDSSRHVIWFLSRVDIDPQCLDVKFSDCYYYCRMLRSDQNSSDAPPLTGWNIPKTPPGIAIAPSTSFSLESEGYHANEMAPSN